MHDSYWSGLFDGEGWVRINKTQPKKTSSHIRYQILMGINMTHKPVMVKIYETFGGAFFSPKIASKNPNHRPQYGWVLGSQMAASFLRRIRPFSIVKAKEIDVALEFQKNLDDNPYHPGVIQPNRQELLDYREKLFLEIRYLKKQVFDTFPSVFNDPIDNLSG